MYRGSTSSGEKEHGKIARGAYSGAERYVTPGVDKQRMPLREGGFEKGEKKDLEGQSHLALF